MEGTDIGRGERGSQALRREGLERSQGGSQPRKRPLGSSGLFSGRRETDLLFEDLGSLQGGWCASGWSRRGPHLTPVQALVHSRPWSLSAGPLAWRPPCWPSLKSTALQSCPDLKTRLADGVPVVSFHPILLGGGGSGRGGTPCCLPVGPLSLQGHTQFLQFSRKALYQNENLGKEVH